MRLLFSEARPDYARYVFPYVVWAFPEPGETPSDLLAAGFLPSARDLSRWYLARQIRVDLARFSPSSENRRILRKGEGLALELVPARDFALDAPRRDRMLAYAAARFGEAVMSEERLAGIFAGAMTTHVLIARDPQVDDPRVGGAEVGWVALLLDPGRSAFYSYAFYDLSGLARNLGLFLMTAAVDRLARDGYRHIHLGTCYSRRALYKTQFAGCEHFDGARWSGDSEGLRALLARDEADPGPHLLEDPEYIARFAPEGLAALAARSPFRGA